MNTELYIPRTGEEIKEVGDILNVKLSPHSMRLVAVNNLSQNSISESWISKVAGVQNSQEKH